MISMGVDLSKQAIWWASTLASKQSDGRRLLIARCLLATGFAGMLSDLAIARQIQFANVSYLSERQKHVVNVGGSILGRQMHHRVVNVVARGAGRG